MSSGGKKGGKGGNKGGNQGGKPEGGQDFKFNFGAEGSDAALKFDFGGKDAAMLPFIQQRLGHLIGKSSGYLESLPEPVQNRVKALKKLHERKSEFDKEYKKELLALQEKFDKLIEPLYDRRRQLVQGTAEPTEEELKEEKKEGETAEAKTEVKKEEGKAEEKDVKGVPDFWMEAFKHHDDFAEMITTKDEAVLKHLIDVRWKSLSGEGSEKYSPASFILEFEFSENPYFTNKVITKTYYLVEHEALGETMFDRMESSPIDWKAGKNVTVRMVQQQQPVGGKRGGRNNRGGRGRGKGQVATKTVMVEEPCESFFNFFNPNVAFGLEDEEEIEEEDMQELMEADYEMGLGVKEQIIPSAVLWFTGEIQSPMAGLDFGMEEGDDEGEDGEYDSAEDPDFEPDPNAPAAEKPECKQQ